MVAIETAIAQIDLLFQLPRCTLGVRDGSRLCSKPAPVLDARRSPFAGCGHARRNPTGAPDRALRTSGAPRQPECTDMARLTEARLTAVSAGADRGLRRTASKSPPLREKPSLQCRADAKFVHGSPYPINRRRPVEVEAETGEPLGRSLVRHADRSLAGRPPVSAARAPARLTNHRPPLAARRDKWRRRVHLWIAAAGGAPQRGCRSCAQSRRFGVPL
jgi:hypothetical protein